MSPTSILELYASGKNLERQNPSTICYPIDGAEALASVEADHFWFTERRRVLLDLIRRFAPSVSKDRIRGLDIGCGSGFTAVWLTERGYPTFGIDAQAGFASMENQGRGFGFLQGDIFSIEPAPEFDFLLLLDTLEHIQDDAKFLDHAGKFLKPGGIVILSVPAFQLLWSATDDRAGHLRRYTKRDIGRFESLPSTSLKRVCSTYFYLSTLPLFLLHRKFASASAESVHDDLKPVRPRVLNLFLRALLRLESLVLRITTLPLGSSLFVVLRKGS